MLHRLVQSIELGTVQTGTGKVDTARKFKCTKAARGQCNCNGTVVNMTFNSPLMEGQILLYKVYQQFTAVHFNYFPPYVAFFVFKSGNCNFPTKYLFKRNMSLSFIYFFKEQFKVFNRILSNTFLSKY